MTMISYALQQMLINEFGSKHVAEPNLAPESRFRGIRWGNLLNFRDLSIPTGLGGREGARDTAIGLRAGAGGSKGFLEK